MSGEDNREGFFLRAVASPESERGVISALLLNNAAFDRVGDALLEEHFFDETYRTIYREIARQINACRVCDVLTVAVALEGKVTLQELNSIAQYVPSAANVRRYVESIFERYKSRQLLAVASEITELARDHDVPIVDRVDSAQSLLVRLMDDTPKEDWVSMEGVMVPTLDALQDREDGKTNAMPTGLADIDKYLSGGFRPGSLIILGARPSMGKTALAMTVATHMAEQYVVGFLSMEMPLPELGDRVVASLGRQSLSALMAPKSNGGIDWARVTDAVEKARVLNLYVSEQSGLTINQVRSKARFLKRVHGLNVLVVDYIGLMEGMDSRQPRAYQLEEISRGLKRLAKELGIAVLCLAQVNRKVEERLDHAPVLSDLRDSGAIEQDADVVMFVHRPIQARPDIGTEWANYAKCTIAKNRQGRCGNLNLHYLAEQTRFANWFGDAPMRATAHGSMTNL